MNAGSETHRQDMLNAATAWRTSQYFRDNIPHAAWHVMQGDVEIVGNLSRSEADRILAAHKSCLPCAAPAGSAPAGYDRTVDAFQKCANEMLTQSLKALPTNVDDWTTDDKLIAQNLVDQFLSHN